MNYKEYSLEQLKNWMHDCMSSGDATPQEIYDTILDVVKENYYIYKDQVSKAYELLTFLNGNGKTFEDVLREKQKSEPSMPPLEYNTKTYDQMIEDGYEMTDDGFWIPPQKEDKVVKWQLPVEMHPSGECYVLFPDDLLQAANLEENDTVEWIDNNDGSFILRKPNGIK